MPIFRFCPSCGHPFPPVDGPAESVVSQICSRCGATHVKNAKPSASAVVVRDGKLLLALRAREPFGGWWNLPGGFLDPWEPPADGAVREVAEETGLVVRPIEILEVAVYRYGDPGDFILNLCYRMEIVGGELRAGDDAARVDWFDFDALPERIAFVGNRALLTPS